MENPKISFRVFFAGMIRGDSWTFCLGSCFCDYTSFSLTVKVSRKMCKICHPPRSSIVEFVSHMHPHRHRTVTLINLYNCLAETMISCHPLRFAYNSPHGWYTECPMQALFLKRSKKQGILPRMLYEILQPATQLKPVAR